MKIEQQVLSAFQVIMAEKGYPKQHVQIRKKSTHSLANHVDFEFDFVFSPIAKEFFTFEVSITDTGAFIRFRIYESVFTTFGHTATASEFENLIRFYLDVYALPSLELPDPLLLSLISARLAFLFGNTCEVFTEELGHISRLRISSNAPSRETVSVSIFGNGTVLLEKTLADRPVNEIVHRGDGSLWNKSMVSFYEQSVNCSILIVISSRKSLLFAVAREERRLIFSRLKSSVRETTSFRKVRAKELLAENKRFFRA